MSLSMYEKQRGGRKGFTLVEIVMATLIGAAVLGGVVMVMSLGVRMMTVNTAYSTAQRGALSTVEMLSDEIPAAIKVEIITDGAHNVSAGLTDGWHYVTLDTDLKEARHVYMEDGEHMDEKVPGSEYIDALSFDTEVFPDELDGGGRLLRVNVEAAHGADDAGRVELDRTLLVHAASGVTGESNAYTGDALPPPSGGGPILRYMPENPLSPRLNLYGSTNDAKPPVGGAPFDYENPVTWKYLKNFNYFTELDARLELPPRLLKAVEKSDEDVIFTWIVADPTIFSHDVVNGSAKENSKAIMEYLEERVPGYLEEEVGWDLLEEKYKIHATPDSEGNLPEEMISELINDPFNMEADDLTKGFQLMAVMKGKPDLENPGIFDVETEPAGADEQKFNLGAAVNGLAMAYDYYKGAYMIVVAQFPDGKDGRKKWPVYVKLGDYKEDTLFTDLLTQLAQKGEDNANTHVGDTFLNAKDTFGKLEEVVTDGERRYFEVTGNIGNGSTPAPIVMKKLTPQDFSHMIPRGTKNKDDILYGVTNYAVYVDAEIPNSGSGGFAVLMNGSKIHMNGSPLDESKNNIYDENAEYTSAGYFYQFDPGANGLLIRYFGYHPRLQYRYGQVNGYQWGARPMYFYDAAKENFPAPGAIKFFEIEAAADTSTRLENFNENAGAGINDKINYRLPFSAYVRDSMFNLGGVQAGGTAFSSATEGRDEEPYGGMRAAHTYGVTQGPGGGATSVYSPKHMQSWHDYGKNIVDMLAQNAKDDKRIGFRWDRSWHLRRANNDADSKIQQPPVWEQRHILKVTILEVTRDIKAGEVDEEWKYNIYHRNDKPLTGGQLTKLADDYVIHKAGDMFVRAELIQLKPGTTDWNNSRNYVYSKPIWHGKFKGDAWRGDDRSPFKKLGNAMQHIVADPEPEEGDDQSYRRRGMRVRSWKESFLGWDFSKVTLPNYRYVWRDFVNGSKETFDKDDPFGVNDSPKTKKFPPDFYKTVYAGAGRVDLDPSKTKTAHSVWTPPLEIDLNADNARANENTLTFASGVRKVFQSGDPDHPLIPPSKKDTGTATAGTFGQYVKSDQYVQRERRNKSGGGYAYAYNGKYSPDTYGRLSLLRPWRDVLPNQTTPIFGLYALRGWDFGTSRLLNDESNKGNVWVYDSEGNTSKRFLSVVQGLQIPYLPTDVRPATEGKDKVVPRDRSPGGDVFKPDRDRIFGFRFWDNAVAFVAASRTRLYDAWIGEGFSPREVRAILGLKTDDKKKIRGTYVHEDMEDAGFYVPLGEYE